MSPEEKKCACVHEAIPAPTPRTELSFRARRQIAATIFLLLAVGLGLLATMIGGCAGASEGCRHSCCTQEETFRGPAFVGNQGSSWEMVFSCPQVALSRANPNVPEYSRNDTVLANRENQPLLATAQWPERARADLAYPRRVSLPRDANTLLFFQTDGYEGYGRRYQPGWSADTPVWDGACWR